MHTNNSNQPDQRLTIAAQLMAADMVGGNASAVRFTPDNCLKYVEAADALIVAWAMFHEKEVA